MPDVTVDLADLETLVWATAALKTIEGTLANRKVDPFVRAHLDFTEAHERCAAAMRNATRAAAGTAVKWDEPLTKSQARALRYVLDAMDKRKSGLPWFVISPAEKAAPGERMGEFDVLAAKGCLKMGQFINGVVWAGASAPDITPDVEKGYAAQITDRGRKKLAEFEAPSK